MESLRIKRKIVSTKLEIDELSSWLGKEVDITISEKSASAGSESSTDSAAGMLSEYQDQQLSEMEKTGWVQAVRDKYGDR